MRPAMIQVSNLAFGGKRSIKSAPVPPHPVRSHITDCIDEEARRTSYDSAMSRSSPFNRSVTTPLTAEIV